jgi:hypothetical protein
MIAGVSIPFVRHCIFLFLFAAAGLFIGADTSCCSGAVCAFWARPSMTGGGSFHSLPGGCADRMMVLL